MCVGHRDDTLPAVMLGSDLSDIVVDALAQHPTESVEHAGMDLQKDSRVTPKAGMRGLRTDERQRAIST